MNNNAKATNIVVKAAKKRKNPNDLNSSLGKNLPSTHESKLNGINFDVNPHEDFPTISESMMISKNQQKLNSSNSFSTPNSFNALEDESGLSDSDNEMVFDAEPEKSESLAQSNPYPNIFGEQIFPLSLDDGALSLDLPDIPLKDLEEFLKMPRPDNTTLEQWKLHLCCTIMKDNDLLSDLLCFIRFKMADAEELDFPPPREHILGLKEFITDELKLKSENGELYNYWTNCKIAIMNLLQNEPHLKLRGEARLTAINHSALIEELTAMINNGRLTCQQTTFDNVITSLAVAKDTLPSLIQGIDSMNDPKEAHSELLLRMKEMRSFELRVHGLNYSQDITFHDNEDGLSGHRALLHTFNCAGDPSYSILPLHPIKEKENLIEILRSGAMVLKDEKAITYKWSLVRGFLTQNTTKSLNVKFRLSMEDLMAISKVDWCPKISIFNRTGDIYKLSFTSKLGETDTLSLNEIVEVLKSTYKWAFWNGAYSMIASPSPVSEFSAINMVTQIAGVIISTIFKPSPHRDLPSSSRIKTITKISLSSERTISYVLVAGVHQIFKEHSTSLIDNVERILNHIHHRNSLAIDHPKLDKMLQDNRFFAQIWEDYTAKRTAALFPIIPITINEGQDPDVVTMHLNWRKALPGERKTEDPLAKTRDEWALNTLTEDTVHTVINGTILCVTRLATLDGSLDSVATRIINWYITDIHKIPGAVTIAVPIFHYIGTPPAPQLENVLITYIPKIPFKDKQALWAKLRIDGKDNELLKIAGWPFEMSQSLRRILRTLCSSQLHFMSEMNKPSLIIRLLSEEVHKELIHIIPLAMPHSDVQAVIRISMRNRKTSYDGWTYLVLMNSTAKEDLAPSALDAINDHIAEIEYSTLANWSLTVFKELSSYRDSYPPWEYDIDGKSWRISRSNACKVWCPTPKEDLQLEFKLNQELVRSKAAKFTYSKIVSSASTVSTSSQSTLVSASNSITSSISNQLDISALIERTINDRIAALPSHQDLTKVYEKISSLDNSINTLNKSIDIRIESKLQPMQNQLYDTVSKMETSIVSKMEALNYDLINTLTNNRPTHPTQTDETQRSTYGL